MNERPTPETDAAQFEFCVGYERDGSSKTELFVEYDFARRLERERDEAREQNAAMREAIREAHEAIEEARAAIAYEAGTWRAVDPCLPKSSSAITKLQPFLDQ